MNEKLKDIEKRIKSVRSELAFMMKFIDTIESDFDTEYVRSLTDSISQLSDIIDFIQNDLK